MFVRITVGIQNPTIWNPDFLKVKFQIVQFSNGWALAMAIAIVPTIPNPNIFVRISNGLWQNGSHLSGFHIVGLLELGSHLRSRPFSTQPLFDHSKSRLVQILDPHFNWILFRPRSRVQRPRAKTVPPPSPSSCPTPARSKAITSPSVPSRWTFQWCTTTWPATGTSHRWTSVWPERWIKIAPTPDATSSWKIRWMSRPRKATRPNPSISTVREITLCVSHLILPFYH